MHAASRRCSRSVVKPYEIQRAHRCGHIAFTYKWGADPISNTAGLGHASPNIGQRQPPDHCVIVAAKNQKRVREIAALIFGISFEPATKGAAREDRLAGHVGSHGVRKARLVTCKCCPSAKSTAVGGATRRRAGNAGIVSLSRRVLNATGQNRQSARIRPRGELEFQRSRRCWKTVTGAERRDRGLARRSRRDRRQGRLQWSLHRPC